MYDSEKAIVYGGFQILSNIVCMSEAGQGGEPEMGREISGLATNNINEQANHLIIKQRDQISCARA